MRARVIGLMSGSATAIGSTRLMVNEDCRIIGGSSWI
jgi:hypothetical protein